MSRPLLSVITPTWKRRDLALETVQHVREQTYPNLEHIVVSDGPDEDLRSRMVEQYADAMCYEGGEWYTPDVTFVDIGRNFTEHGPANSFGVGAITAGLLLARGDYLTWWCDDERALVPDHLEQLVNLLESTGADFAYPRVRMHWNGQPVSDGWDIGTDPPAHGQITHFVFRASLLNLAMPEWGAHPVDWTLVKAWMAAGASWAMLDRVTFSHRADR